ncbi:unnamed protein product [Vicia faba]|uniref:Uncharacterized protein n=1 Tax=Vicia faba TaxID=3906 RepID=A0AAV1ANG9_VICFA|nr:unnamed protein product [Vicia faba]
MCVEMSEACIAENLEELVMMLIPGRCRDSLLKRIIFEVWACLKQRSSNVNVNTGAKSRTMVKALEIAHQHDEQLHLNSFLEVHMVREINSNSCGDYGHKEKASNTRVSILLVVTCEIACIASTNSLLLC